MINNYNSSGWRIDTHPETQLSNVIGSPPTSSGKSTSTSWLSSLFLLVFMLLGFNSFSQTAINYSLATTSGTFNSIASTGTSVAVAGDDIGINITGLPAFNVNGVNYINARMCSNGWLALYASTAPTVSTNYSSLSTAMPNGAVIFAPLSVDMDIASVGTTAAYRQTIGNENIFEWSNFARYSITGDSFSFQIRLDTVTGAVRFVYGAFTLGVSTSNAQVGWKTTGTTASNWLTDISNVNRNIIIRRYGAEFFGYVFKFNYFYFP